MNERKKVKKYEDLVFDVGMHKGEDTCYYLKKGFKVISFEADPDLVSHCRNRFKDEIENGKLVIVEGAIIEHAAGETKEKTIKFYKNKDSTVWGTVASDWADRNETLGTSSEIIEVPAINFASCIEKHGIPHYLKIDIEGMDTVCLKALIGFDQKPDYISIESEKLSFDNLEKELDLFSQLGYSKFKAVQQKGISHQKEPNPSKEGSYSGYKFPEGSSGLFGEDLPGDWKNYKSIRSEYKNIFILYKLFGDYGKLKNYYVGKILKKGLARLLKGPVPGWYDTHAKHSLTTP